MASLSGNKIKDTFNLLLKLANSNVGSSEQVVQDGAGNNSALKISTDTVETTGALKISGTPSTSTSVTSALMLSSSGVVVTRNLSTSPIGTASITANTPLSATGSTIELKDPALLSQITQPATNDKYLIWDESTSAYKYIEQSDLATAVGNSITAGTLTQGIMFARQSATIQMSTTAVVAIGSYAEIYEDSSATTSTTATGSSVYFGTLVNTASPPLNGLTLGTVSDPRDAVLINEIEGWFRITGTIQVILTAGADFNIEVGGTIIRSITTSADAGEISTITLQALYYSDGVSGYMVRLTGKADGLGVNVYATQTSLEVDYMGDNATL
jgi:hypothetical protein